MKFNHLNVPTHWRNYWSRYPEGHTILEALISWVSQVDSMVDNQNKLNDNVEQFRIEIDAFVGRFDERLQDEVTQTLNDWQTSGFLDVVISEALQWELDDYKATNEADKGLITTQLQETTNKTKGIVNLADFPKVDGDTSDSERVNRAIEALTSHDKLTLYSGVLEIDKPIMITKRGAIIESTGTTVFKVVSEMETGIIIEPKDATSIITHVKMNGIHVDCNNLSDYGVSISGSPGLYASEIQLNNGRVINAKKDGISIIAPVWMVDVTNYRLEYNARDGIRAIMSGINQLNVVKISKCFIQNNGGNGITINGTDHVIEKNVVERNKNAGVSIDSTLNNVVGKTSWVIKPFLTNNYMEINEGPQVLIKTVTGENVVGLTLKDNYLLSEVNDGNPSLIECTGTGGIRLYTSANYYSKRGTTVNDIDGGNILLIRSNIEDTGNVVNAGYARLSEKTTSAYDIVAFPIGTVYGLEYTTSTQESVNVVASTSKKITFGLNENIYLKGFRSLSVKVRTDSTNSVVKLHSVIRNARTGVVTRSTFEDITLTSSGLASTVIANSWKQNRVKEDEYAYFEISLVSSNGTYLHFGIPFVEMF